jgi:uncharacterized protein (UPF0179 family)
VVVPIPPNNLLPLADGAGWLVGGGRKDDRPCTTALETIARVEVGGAAIEVMASIPLAMGSKVVAREPTGGDGSEPSEKQLCKATMIMIRISTKRSVEQMPGTKI